jgi:hypothetical protein
MDMFEQMQRFLPPYLFEEDRRRLFDELSAFPSSKGFYLHPNALDDELLQGDGWFGLYVTNFYSLEQKSVSGLIISNSCDIDVKNTRDLPSNVVFAPLIPLGKYRALLESAGRTPEQIESKLSSIRAQRVSSVFYLPSDQHGPQEAIILLDQLYSHPLPAFLEADRRRLFRLGQYGFYLLLFKLSIHLSRFQEGVKRYA